MSASNYPETAEGAALTLMNQIHTEEADAKIAKWGSDYRKYILDLYAECLDATKGNRYVQPTVVT